MMKRRDFLFTSVTASIGLATGTGLNGWVPQGISKRYDGLESEEFFDGPVKIVARVPDREGLTEGPASAPDGGVYFTNIPASRIYRWNPGERTLSVFREDTAQANGLIFTTDGDLLVCEQERGRVVRVRHNGKSEIVVDHYRDELLEAPNDLTIDRQGRIYFSSRPTSTVPSRGSVNAVYRVDPDGKVSRLLKEPEVDMPNGLAFSPDEKTLYLVEAHPDEGRNRHIRAYPLRTDGSLGQPDVILDFYPGRSGDGMCVDSQGNLYVAAGLHARRGTSETLDTRPGIHVIAPSGQLLAFKETPVDTVTNCTFGGENRKTLYITAGHYLLSVQTRITG